MTREHRRALENAVVHWREVYGLAFVIIGDRGLAEELSQEAYLRVTKAAPNLDLERPLRNLLMTTVRNLALNERRRRRPDALDAERVVDEDASEPIDRLVERERSAALNDALAALRPAWREAVFLKDGLGLRYREIAEVLETSEDVIRTTLHRARQRLRAGAPA